MRIVIALGGNALLAPGERPDASVQRSHVRAAARAVAPLAAEHELIISHGNGPQVGVLAVESDADRTLSSPYPLDVLGAETQGMIGYWLTQELRNAGVRRPIACVLTQTVVDSFDPAFAVPTKFIGAGYEESLAQTIVDTHGWAMAADGARWRRVVPSPQPRRIVEGDVVATLVNAGTVVVCGGGGGAPVVQTPDGTLRGVEAVIDKDLTAAVLALALKAQRLVLLTDVSNVMRAYRTPHAQPIKTIDVDSIRQLDFPAGSMGPKVEACVRFASASGQPAVIGALDDAVNVLAGRAGTTITPAPSPP